jgi:hypothetical protein
VPNIDILKWGKSDLSNEERLDLRKQLLVVRREMVGSLIGQVAIRTLAGIVEPNPSSIGFHTDLQIEYGRTVGNFAASRLEKTFAYLKDHHLSIWGEGLDKVRQLAEKNLLSVIENETATRWEAYNEGLITAGEEPAQAPYPFYNPKKINEKWTSGLDNFWESSPAYDNDRLVKLTFMHAKDYTKYQINAEEAWLYVRFMSSIE